MSVLRDLTTDPGCAADIVIIGAGSAGCIVAGRLAACGVHVLLVEAGPSADLHPETLRADGFKDAFANDALMWHRMSVADRSRGEKSVFVGTGRGLGGSGSVNGMVYTRPDAQDFSHWPQGWDWESVQAAFTAVESSIEPAPMRSTPFLEKFFAGAQGLGLRRRDGLMDGDLSNVVGSNALNHDGVNRNSSYRKWLHEQSHGTLQIMTDCRVLNIDFASDEAGQHVEGDSQRESHLQSDAQGRGARGRVRATGLTVERRGRQQHIGVGRELVICAGALETPRLLQLSGIGPVDVLQRAGVRIVRDVPGIGRGLKDHPNVPVFFRAREAVDFSFPQAYAFEAVAPHAGLATTVSDTCYVCYGAPGSIRESTLRMLPALALPGALHSVMFLRQLVRAVVNLAFMTPLLQRFVSRLFAVVVILGKPRSVGHVEIVSADPSMPARIAPGYFSHSEDRLLFEKAVERAITMVRQGPLSGSRLLSKAAAAASSMRRWKWIRSSTLTTYHFCGTCRMGDDAASPVDAQLCLRAASNIRIADASVFPEIPVCATNAASMMVGWRAADFILKGRS